MRDVYILGAAMTDFGRRDLTLLTATEQAAKGVLEDANLTADRIRHVFVGNAAAGILQGQEMIRGQVLLRNTGLLGSTIVNVENACSSSSTALYLAVMAVRSGEAEVAMALGVEQLRVPQKERSFAALAAATDTVRRVEMREIVEGFAFSGQHHGSEIVSSPLMVHYAEKANEYMERTGATVEDFARVVVKSRLYGSLNPKAQFHGTTTVEEVLSGRLIVDPLRREMCSPLGDGAAAVIVASANVARELGNLKIRVRAITVVSNDPWSNSSPTAAASRLAYEAGGIGPEDIDLAEVHDAAAPAELIIMEELGLVPPGTAHLHVRNGSSSLGGSLPINTSGGLLSRGHPIGATGCAQIVELADQLRYRAGQRQVPGARVGLAQNGGGVFEGDEATVSVSILERVDEN